MAARGINLTCAQRGILADWMTRNKNVAHNEIVNSSSLFRIYVWYPPERAPVLLSQLRGYHNGRKDGKNSTTKTEKQKDNKGLARKCHQSSLAKQQSDSFNDATLRIRCVGGGSRSFSINRTEK